MDSTRADERDNMDNVGMGRLVGRGRPDRSMDLGTKRNAALHCSYSEVDDRG